MKKNINALWVIPILIICFIIIYMYSYNFKSTNRNIIVESNSYKNAEMKDDEIFDEDVYKYLSSIDNVLLNTLNIENPEKLSSEDKIIIILNYISKNENLYMEKIVNLHKQFVYTESDTKYFSIGFIDKKELLNIIQSFFDISDINLEESKFYDKDTSYMAVVPTMTEYIDYESSRLVDISIDKDNIYNLHVKYIRNIYEKTNEIDVLYKIKRITGKYCILNYQIMDSKVY